MSSLVHKVWLLTGRRVPLPSLDLNLLSGSLPAGVTFTRAAGPATYFNSAGTLQTAGTNVARFDADPVTHAPLGLLIEETRTNLILQSQFAATWTVTGSTLTANVVASPDGGTTAARLQEDGTNGNHFTAQSITKAASSLTYAVTAFFKQGVGTRNIQFLIDDGGGTNGVAGTVNPSTGAIVSAIAAIGAGFSGTPFVVTALLNGWYRFTFTVTTNTATTIRAVLFMASGGSTAYQGDNASNVQTYGFQTELGGFPTSYMPTTTVATTRAAELALISPVPGYLGPASTMAAEAMAPALPGKSVTLLSLTDAVPNKITLFTNAGNIPAMFTSTGLNQTLGASIAANVVNKIGGAFANASQRGAFNGAITNASIATIPQAATTLCVGSDLTGGQSNSWIRRVRYWPQALNATQLQQVTR